MTKLRSATTSENYKKRLRSANKAKQENGKAPIKKQAQTNKKKKQQKRAIQVQIQAPAATPTPNRRPAIMRASSPEPVSYEDFMNAFAVFDDDDDKENMSETDEESGFDEN